MTVASTKNKMDPYVCDGERTAFDFDFKIFQTDELAVILLDTETGQEIQLELTTDYTVAAVNHDFTGGGTVTLNAAPDAAHTVTILRRLAITQTSDYKTADKFPAAMHESNLDKLTMICQQLSEELQRAVTASVTEGTGLTLPIPLLRANKYLGFDNNGNFSVNDGPLGDTIVTSFIQTLLDDATAATARATLGVTLANLGVSAFIQTLLDDANAATARATLELGNAATLTADSDGTLAANSDGRVPTQKAVRTFAASQGFFTRGITETVDYTVGDLVIDDAYHDLDLSAIVPAAARAVLVNVGIKATATNARVLLRNKNEVGTYTYVAAYTQVAGINSYSQFTLPYPGGLECRITAAGVSWNVINLVVTGWFL